MHPVPAARAALLALLRARYDTPDSTVRVDHGPPRALRDVPDAIGVGTAALSDTAGSGQTVHRLGQREESFDLVVAIDSATGDDETGSDGDVDDGALAGCEERAYELLDDLHEVLEENRTLGGAVMTAVLTRHTYRPRRGEDGTGAYIEATVRIVGFRPRRP